MTAKHVYAAARKDFSRLLVKRAAGDEALSLDSIAANEPRTSRTVPRNAQAKLLARGQAAGNLYRNGPTAAPNPAMNLPVGDPGAGAEPMSLAGPSRLQAAENMLGGSGTGLTMHSGPMGGTPTQAPEQAPSFESQYSPQRLAGGAMRSNPMGGSASALKDIASEFMPVAPGGTQINGQMPGGSQSNKQAPSLNSRMPSLLSGLAGGMTGGLIQKGLPSVPGVAPTAAGVASKTPNYMSEGMYRQPAIMENMYRQPSSIMAAIGGSR